MEAVKSLFEERKELFDNAIQMKKTTRTPMFANFFTWKIIDAGYKFSEAMSNYDIMEKIQCEFHERYQFDAYADLGTRNPLRVTDALGASNHKVDDINESVVVEDHKLMERDEYRELAKDPQSFFWSKAFARYAPNLTIQQLKKAAQELIAFGQYTEKMNNKFLNEYQCLLAPGFYFFPFDVLFVELRGIKELSGDLRRCKSEMLDAIESIYKSMTAGRVKAILASDTNNFFCDLSGSFLGHSILSEKQFGEFYWPHIKKIFDMLNGKTMYIFCESEMLRFAEFFQDIPKGQLMIHVEQDNISEIHKTLPNISFMGGMTTDLLGHGTKQQCVDYAKKLINEFGDGFVFSTTKMISFRNDCTRENLSATTDFVRNYKH